MADLAQMERALRNADAAGDTAAAQQIAAAIREQRAQPAQDKPENPTDNMSPTERRLAGAGRGMSAGWRAITSALGSHPVGDLNRAIHDALPVLGGVGRLPTPAEAAAARTEAARLEAPLMATKEGRQGNIFGLGAVAAPTTLLPGANTAMGATLIGGGTGFLTTEGGLKDRAEGAAAGALGGLAGKYIGDGLGAGARWLADRFAQRATAANAAAAPRMAAAQAGAREGYVVPPADLQPGLATELLSGLSGKVKTAQAASVKNQGVTNTLAARDLGLPQSQPITREALEQVRAAAGRSGYAPIRAAGEVTTDATYGKALDAIVGQYQGAGRSFPGLAKNPVVDMVENLRQAKFDAGDALDAVKVLRSMADDAYGQGNTSLAKAARAASTAVEDQLERHLEAAGNKSAMQAFREARTQIAKSFSVKINPATGDVNAAYLAKQLEKGRPLSGDLKTIAEFASAFPKATQPLKEAPKSMSPLDMAMAMGGGLGTGNLVGAAAWPLARVGARSLLLSSPVQSAALRGTASPGLLTQLPAAVLDQQLIRNGMPGLLGLTAAQLTSE